MALSSDNVRVAVTGGVYRAPEGTALPVDATTALNVAFLELGYVSEDGVTESQGSDTNDIVAWQNGDIVRKVQTSHDLTYAFSMLETNDNVIAAFYGNGTAAEYEINGEQPGRFSWVLEVLDGDHHIRVVLPSAQVTERGDKTFVNGDAIMYPFTLTAYPDPDYAGAEDAPAKAYVYMDDGTP